MFASFPHLFEMWGTRPRQIQAGQSLDEALHLGERDVGCPSSEIYDGRGVQARIMVTYDAKDRGAVVIAAGQQLEKSNGGLIIYREVERDGLLGGLAEAWIYGEENDEWEPQGAGDLVGLIRCPDVDGCMSVAGTANADSSLRSE